MSRSLARVVRAADDLGLSIVMQEVAEAKTAAQAAEAVDCDVDQIAKSIVFRGAVSDAPVLFLTAGGNLVDPALAARVAGEPLGKADAAFIRAKTGFAIGGVAPIGHTGEVRAFWDPRLSAFEVVWAAGGTPRHVFATNPAHLLAATAATPAQFTR